MNLVAKLQLVKVSLRDEITPNENHFSTCAGSIIYQQAYLLLSKYEFTLEYITMNLPRCKQENIVSTQSLRTCLGFKGCFIRLAMDFQKLAAWAQCDTRKMQPLARLDRSSVQAPSLALAGLCVPVFLLWDSLCHEQHQSPWVLVHRLMPDYVVPEWR